MFNKLKDLFKSKPPVELNIDNITSFLNQEFEALINEEKGKTQLLIDDLLNEISMLKNLILELKEKESENTFANSVKNKFCLGALELIENMGKPDLNYSSLKDFLTASETSVNSINNIGVKEIIHLRQFKANMDSIANKTKLIIDKNKKLNILLKGMAIEKVSIVENRVKDIKARQNTIADMDKSIQQLDNEINNSENTLKEKKSQLEQFLNDERFSNLGLVSNEIEELEKNKSLIKQQITTDFSGIDKMLKKFQHSGFASKEEEKIINSYVTDSAAFLADDKLEIRNILEKVKQKLENNELDVEEKRHDKIGYLLNNLNSLTEKRNQYKITENSIIEKNKQKAELLPILDEKAMREKEIEDHEKRPASTKEKMQQLTTDIEAKKKVINADKDQLESMLKDLLKRDVSVIL